MLWKLLQNFFLKLCNGIFYWLTNCPMLSGKHNLRDTGLIFLLFDIASAQEVPFEAPLFIQTVINLSVPSFVSHSSLLTTKSVNFVVCTSWLPFIMEIIHNFHHSRYFDYWGPFQAVVDSYYCIMGWTQPSNKVSSFQTIIDIIGVQCHGMCGFASNVIIIMIVSKKKYKNKYIKN